MLKKFVLGSRAYHYLRDELLLGDCIGEFLRHLNFWEGQILTYLPEDLDTEGIPDFGDSLSWQFGNSILSDHTRIMIDLIDQYLREDGNSVYLYETFLSTDDLRKRDLSVPYVIFSDKIIGFLMQDCSREDIDMSIKTARHYPFISILTKMTHRMDHRDFTDEDVLRRAVGATDVAFIGAFDDEGVLIWSRNGSGNIPPMI